LSLLFPFLAIYEEEAPVNESTTKLLDFKSTYRMKQQSFKKDGGQKEYVCNTQDSKILGRHLFRDSTKEPWPMDFGQRPP
jgi:hypothetical protein